MTLLSILQDNYNDMKPQLAEKPFGAGDFGEVFLATIQARQGPHRSWPGGEAVVKDLKVEVQAVDFMREVEIMAMVNHVTCMTIRAANYRDGNRKILMDKMPYSLDSILTQAGDSRLSSPWDDTAKSCTILGIAAGLAYLHSVNIIHRDVKPKNVLMDDTLRPRISDFGLANLVPLDRSPYGTSAYMAPELFGSNPNSGAAVDVYAFGITVWSILTNERPFSTTDSLVLPDLICHGARPRLDAVQDERWHGLLKKWWHADPSERGTMLDILQNSEQLRLDGAALTVFNNYRDLVMTGINVENA
jgi:serine/threonine protein kinase